MTTDWSPLHRELALWRSEGMELPLWWRDDDAGSHTEELDQLVDLSGELEMPVHLAIIPGDLEDTLISSVQSNDNLIPMVHGWVHENHSPKGQKRAEFGQPRDGATTELQRSVKVMQNAFGADLLPIFVPPWNRFHDSFVQTLAGSGIRGLSAFSPRTRATAAPGIAQINTHIDPIDWHGTRSLVSPDKLIAQLVEILHDRRTGVTDAREPLGYLTHHLVHDAKIWEFSRALLSELLDNGATIAHLHTQLEHAA